MKPTGKKAKISRPVLVLLLAFGAFILVYSTPDVLTFLLSEAQSTQHKQIKIESASLQPIFQKASCTLKSKSFSPGVDIPPSQLELYSCPSLDLSALDHDLLQQGFVKNNSIKQAYPTAMYTFQHGPIHDTIIVDQKEINLTISD